MYKHILAPTDGSPLSCKAVVHAVKLARSVGARVTGLFAAPPATPIIYRNSLPVGYVPPREHARLIEQTSARYLDFVERTAKKAGVRCEVVSVTSDYPADTILDVARKKKCDLIVMGMRGQGGLRGVLIGSQTQKVLVGSRIPVLVMR